LCPKEDACLQIVLRKKFQFWMRAVNMKTRNLSVWYVKHNLASDVGDVQMWITSKPTNINKENRKDSREKVTTSCYIRNVCMGDREELLAATAATFAYNTAKHYHSFRSIDCTTEIIKEPYDKKFTCSRQ
jgi:hypothetical protein